MRAVGDYLLVSDALMSVHLGMIDLPSGQVLHRFGRHGEGPGEFRDPSASAVPGSRDRVWIYDFQNRRASLLRLDRRTGAELEEEIRMDHGVSLETPIWTAAGIVANGLFQDYTLLAMDTKGKRMKRVAADPPFDARRIAHPTGRRLLNRSFLAADPERRRLALAYQFEGRVDFFTADGRRYGSVAGPRETQARWRVVNDRFVWDDANEMAYWQIEATERYVYTLFCGCQIEAQRDPSRLHVFRWNGDFVGEIELDRPVSAFTVSPDDKVLYGSFEEQYEAVGEWRLPAWLQVLPGS